MKTENEVIEKLKVQLIQQLNLVEIKPADIDAEKPLFNEGLGLDSIDALEIIVLLERSYGIKIKNTENIKAVFYSVKTLAAFIAQKENQ